MNSYPFDVIHLPPQKTTTTKKKQKTNKQKTQQHKTTQNNNNNKKPNNNLAWIKHKDTVEWTFARFTSFIKTNRQTNKKMYE